MAHPGEPIAVFGAGAMMNDPLYFSNPALGETERLRKLLSDQRAGPAPEGGLL